MLIGRLSSLTPDRLHRGSVNSIPAWYYPTTLLIERETLKLAARPRYASIRRHTGARSHLLFPPWPPRLISSVTSAIDTCRAERHIQDRRVAVGSTPFHPVGQNAPSAPQYQRKENLEFSLVISQSPQIADSGLKDSGGVPMRAVRSLTSDLCKGIEHHQYVLKLMRHLRTVCSLRSIHMPEMLFFHFC